MQRRIAFRLMRSDDVTYHPRKPVDKVADFTALVPKDSPAVIRFRPWIMLMPDKRIQSDRSTLLSLVATPRALLTLPLSGTCLDVIEYPHWMIRPAGRTGATISIEPSLNQSMVYAW